MNYLKILPKKLVFKQECIPVGCVPSPAVAISRGGEVSAWEVSARGVSVQGCLSPCEQNDRHL